MAIYECAVAPRKGSVGGNEPVEFGKLLAEDVAPRKGSVGLKPGHQEGAQRGEGRSPQGERG